MRFTYAESMTDPSFYGPLARAAEEAGYHTMVISDSICYPEHADSVYPYNPDGSREFLEDKPFLEPFSLIPALGAVTERLKFVTFVLKMPVRNPVLTAKQATSTAVLTGNRLVLGVGTSPWREDYDVLAADWASRGPPDGRVDRDPARAHGRRVLRVPRQDLRPAVDQDRAGAGRADPDPDRRPCGRGAAACRPGRRRLDARRGDPEDLPGLLAKLRAFRAAEGTADRPFEIHVISMDAYTLDGRKREDEDKKSCGVRGRGHSRNKTGQEQPSAKVS